MEEAWKRKLPPHRPSAYLHRKTSIPPYRFFCPAGASRRGGMLFHLTVISHVARRFCHMSPSQRMIVRSGVPSLRR